MGKLVLKMGVVFLLMFIMGAGCRKEQQENEVLWEIFPDSENAIIKNEVNGIEFKFCLLTELGEPATVFNENSNFIFNFSFKNNQENLIVVTTEFINSDFYRVYRSVDNHDMGKPWTGIWCDFSGLPQEIVLASSSEKSLNCPWILTENDSPDYPLCMAENKPFLKKGEYSTSIDLDFHFALDGKQHTINNIKYKINFKIQ